MKKIITILTLVILPSLVQAQDAFYVSGMLGMSKMDTGDGGIDLGTELSYGLRAGLLFNDNFSAGIYLQKFSDSVAAPTPFTGDIDADFLNLLAEVTYYFNVADENTFWVSGLLGTSQATYSCPTGLTSCEDASETTYGASFGYHFMVAPNFSVSPQVTYVMFNSDPDTTSMFSGLVNLTMWL